MSFFRRIFSLKILPSWTIFLFDAFIVAASVVFAYFVRRLDERAKRRLFLDYLHVVGKV